MLDCNQIGEFNTAINVEPPDVHKLTDEDSGDEDDINHLSGYQLKAQAIISNASRGDNCNPLDEVPIIAPLEPENAASSKRKKTARRQGYEWKKKTETAIRREPFPEPNYSSFESLSEAKLFELLFDDKLIDLIVDQSTQYCLSKNRPNLNVTKEEIKEFSGILIVSGYNPLGSKRDYWFTGDD